MRARRSYLRSLTNGAASAALPLLRPPAVPLWPVRPLGTEFLAPADPPTEASFPLTREADRGFEASGRRYEVGDDAVTNAAWLNPVDRTVKVVMDGFAAEERSPVPEAKNASSKAVERVHAPPGTAPNHPALPAALQPAQPASSAPTRTGKERMPDGIAHPTSRGEMHAAAAATPLESMHLAQPRQLPPEPVLASIESATLPPDAPAAEPRHRKVFRGANVAENSEQPVVHSGQPRSRSAPQAELHPLPVPERIAIWPATPSAQFHDPREHQEASSANTVHIGNIDIHIAPPPPAAVPRRATRTAPASSTAGLARGFISPFGLRQG